MNLMDQWLMEVTGDMSKLPEDDISSIKKSISSGAKDKDQQWANALQLVHQAYKANDIERPTPDMASGWRQYEAMLSHAVKQLRKFQPDDKWRMSAAMFHESVKPQILVKYKVNITTSKSSSPYVISTADFEGTINNIEQNLPSNTTMKDSSSDGITILSFYKHNVKQDIEFKITKIK